MPRLLPLLTLALLAVSCRYTSFPLIPATLAGSFPSRFETKGLALEGGDLVLRIKLLSPDAGYLGVIWFEDDEEAGRDSVYLDANLREAVFRMPAKAGLGYRTNLIFKGDVVRQFEYTPPK